MAKTVIADIAGGQKPKAREIGDNLTIDHIWSIYRWYPGFRDLLNLEVDAIFSNGINQDEKIDTSRLLECKEGVRWSLLAGYSVIVVDARNPDNRRIEAWHPFIEGVGFVYTDFSTKGHPILIRVNMKADQAGNPIYYDIPHYPCEVDADGEYMTDQPIDGGYGFFPLRTQGNIKGVQGLPQYLHLIDTFKIQWDIMKAYAPFAEKQGMGFPTIFLEENTKDNRNSVKTQFASQPTANRLLIMSMNDGIEYLHPQAGGYDPFPMLQWLNTTIARASQMNRLMLEGEGAGALASSETAVSRWETKQKEKQSYWRTQFLGVWIALGGDEDCNFKDPAHPTFINLMEGLKAMREAMEGLIMEEDIVNLMNEYLESNDQKRDLHALPEEDLARNQTMEEDGNGDSGSTDNKGSKADKE